MDVASDALRDPIVGPEGHVSEDVVAVVELLIGYMLDRKARHRYAVEDDTFLQVRNDRPEVAGLAVKDHVPAEHVLAVLRVGQLVAIDQTVVFRVDRVGRFAGELHGLQLTEGLHESLFDLCDLLFVVLRNENPRPVFRRTVRTFGCTLFEKTCGVNDATRRRTFNHKVFHKVLIKWVYNGCNFA